MKTTERTLAAMISMFSLVGTGCYTQVGSVRDDKFSGEYQDESSFTQEQQEAGDTTSESTDPYFDEYGNPRNRFYLGYSYPYGVSVGFGWYDPWYSRPWYDDPYWGWNPYPAYYSPWWYPYSGYYPPYGGYYGGYYGCHYGGAYTTTRTIGTTRGTGATRGVLGSSRGANDNPGGITPARQDLPMGVRAAPGTRATTPGAVTPARGKSGGPGTRTEKAVRQRTGTNGRAITSSRLSPKRPNRNGQPPPPPSYNPGSGSARGGGRIGASAPAGQHPSGSSGGTRGGGSSGGGGGTRGGGSSGGGGRR